jgi:hypothetical protein
MRVASSTFTNQVKSVYSGARKPVPLMLGSMQAQVILEQLVHWLHPEISCGTLAEKEKSLLYADKLSDLTSDLKVVIDYFLNDHNNLPREQRNNLNSLPINIQAILKNYKVD